MKPLNDLTTLTKETFDNWVAGLDVTSLDKLAIKQYADQLRNKLSHRNMQIRELKKKLTNKSHKGAPVLVRDLIPSLACQYEQDAKELNLNDDDELAIGYYTEPYIY